MSNINVYDLALEDTALSVVSRRTTKGNGPEYAGPCPRCGGSDRFHVQPERRDGGAWMCRNCYDATEKGWGDNIAYLIEIRGKSFRDARDQVRGQVEDALERIDALKKPAQPQGNAVPGPAFQQRAQAFVKAAEERLWSASGVSGLAYLHSRGLKDETIRAARLGSVERAGTEYIVFPWYDSELAAYWRVQIRNITPDIPREKRYTHLDGGSNSGLYLSECLKRNRPTFIVEGEIDALTLAQEAGDRVNVVATGTTTGSRLFRWESRLALMPIVFQSFDSDSDGEKHSGYWLNVLSANAIRYRPLAHDVNEMHTTGYNVRTWVEGALLLLEDASEPIAESVAERVVTPDQDAQQSEDQAASEPLLCSVCGLDAIEDDGFYFSLDGVPFCSAHGPDAQQAAQSPEQSEDQAEDTRAAFMRVVSEVATAALLPDVQIGPIEPRQTLKAFLSERGIRSQDASREYEPVTLPALPRKQCPHERFEERVQKVPGSVSTFKYLKRSLCSGVPGPHGFCSDHEPVHLLLSLACKLDYPRLQVSEALIIESGAGCWEEFAIRSMVSVAYQKNNRTCHTEKRLTKVLPRLKAMLDQAGREQAA